MKLKLLAAAPAALILSSCATPPGRIDPVAVSANTYSGYSCSALAAERARVKADYDTVAKKQSDAAVGDAIGVFLIAVPVSSLAGADHKTDVAVDKGKLIAIDQERTKKGCGGNVK